MAYVHFEDVSEVIVSTELATQPAQLVTFLVSATLQQQTIQHHQQAQRARSQSWDAAHGGRGSVNLSTLPSTQGAGVSDRVNLLPHEAGSANYGTSRNAGAEEDELMCETALPSELSASLAALRVITKAQRLLHDHIQALREQGRHQCGEPESPVGYSLSGAGGSGRGSFIEGITEFPLGTAAVKRSPDNFS